MMSFLFFIKSLCSFLIVFCSLHATEVPLPSSHVMVLGEIKEEDLTKLKDTFAQQRPALPSLDFETTENGTIRSFQANRQEWIRFLSKTLLEERLQFYLDDSVQCLFFPESAQAPLTACALIGLEDEMATLEITVLELKQIALYGIGEWELTKAKEQAWDRLYNTSTQRAEKISIVLQSISTKDIQTHLDPLYSQIDQKLQLSQYQEYKEEDLSIQVQLCSTNLNATAPFYSLYISDTDKQTIHWVIHTIAKNNPVKLGLNQKEIRKKGDKIQHVHPLRFLSFVMGEGGLRSDMHKIKKSGFKWNNFIKDYSNRLSREASSNNLNAYVPGFAHSLAVDEQTIQSMIDRHDWHGLVNYFL